MRKKDLRNVLDNLPGHATSIPYEEAISWFEFADLPASHIDQTTSAGQDGRQLIPLFGAFEHPLGASPDTGTCLMPRASSINAA